MSALPNLVRALPEIYQPIMGHPELSVGASRVCVDRLEHVASVYHAVERLVGRPLRVLDLGCAQGFFSHHLAALGAHVHGVDYLDANISVCKALAEERRDTRSTFETASIEHVLAQADLGEFDLVIALSVFHHIAYEKGAAAVKEMLGSVATSALCTLVELATSEEPVYWASAQPASSRDFLEQFAFVHETSQHGTHLSGRTRPLFFVSNRVWYVNGQAGRIASWTTESHKVEPNAHHGTRRFFFGDGVLAKMYRLDVDAHRDPNLFEWQNEVQFLSDPVANFSAPKLLNSGRNDVEAWIVRELLDGETLNVLIQRPDARYDPGSVVRQILQQLCALEAAGLYHSDLRTWNVLVREDGSAILIDYGGIVPNRHDCVWPHDVFLSFIIFMREVFGRTQDRPVPFRAAWLSPDSLPVPFRRIAWVLLSTAPERRTFQHLIALLDDRNVGEASDILEDRAGIANALSALESLSESYRQTLISLLADRGAREVDVELLSRRLQDEAACLTAERLRSAKLKTRLIAANRRSEMRKLRIKRLKATLSWQATRPLRRLARQWSAMMRTIFGLLKK